MRIFGIDPGSTRTGYGCVETDGTRHRLVTCGALTPPTGSTFPERLHVIHDGLSRLLRDAAPACVVVENLFYARNVRSALQLGHARGVALLAAQQVGVPVVEYTPAEIKLAVVGYGRADKVQMQQMVKLLLGLTEVPTPHDAADALAAALCHVHSGTSALEARATRARPKHLRNWRDYKPAATARRQAP
ncbi:MAG: crossover junction endodeoxyribonuclease RuvC [Acidimicrobiia bacterium]|nr:crossover junction endodeoxyribonuclease RuvC [Acidimicrobiia bacterium]